ncbi:MAG: amino acid permease, partial [Candidatus Woesearchaeota archaeon]|nr:amino acid permease [Candidatus Woesearchaeota archaeon]
MPKLELFEAIATIVGCIIGAGILGIPYVIAKSGFITGAMLIILLGIVIIVLYLYLGEIVLRTKGKHQLTGYAEKYLGRWGKFLMMISMLVGLYGALIAYFIGEGDELSAIFGGSPIYYTILFFLLGATLLYFGIETLEKSELFSVIAVLLIISVIIFFTYPHVNVDNLRMFDISKFFVPFGVLLFAYTGMIAVPEANEMLSHDKRRLKTAVAMGVLIPIIVYFVFSLVVVGSIGLSGFESLAGDQRIATIALGMVVNPNLFLIANLFAVFAMFTSFMAVGFALKEMLIYDYDFKKKTAWAMTCFVPLIIALLSVTNFIQVIEIAGVIAGGINAVLILLMFH